MKIDLATLKEKDLANLEKRSRLFRSPLLERVKMEIAADKLHRLYRMASLPRQCISWLPRFLMAQVRKIAG